MATINLTSTSLIVMALSMLSCSPSNALVEPDILPKVKELGQLPKQDYTMHIMEPNQDINYSIVVIQPNDTMEYAMRLID